MAKTTKAFQDGLTIISIWGFFVIALNSFTSINLSQWQTGVLMVVAGGALLVEGQIFTIKEWIKDGIQGKEVPLFLTIVVGAFTLIAGILSLLKITSTHIITMTGFISIFAIIFIAMQRWLID